METNYEGKDLKATVLRIERSSIHDGEGYRTVVFLKGCPLRCAWCSTPESQSFEPEATSENVYGAAMTVEQVMKEVRKDLLFYFHSGGGMTLSGGEALAQPEFTRCLLRQARREGVDTAVETSLHAPWKVVESVLPSLNTMFADIKLIDPEKHRKYCRVSNELILDNLISTNGYSGRLRLVVRVPIIPGINDSDEELRSVGRFCAGLKHLDHVQLLPYHRLGTATYKKLGRPYELESLQPPSAEHMESCRAVLSGYVDRVR